MCQSTRCGLPSTARYCLLPPRTGCRRMLTGAARRRPQGLTEAIPDMKAFEWGRLKPAEAQGMSHVFVTTFATAAGRDAYLAHPAHEARPAATWWWRWWWWEVVGSGGGGDDGSLRAHYVVLPPISSCFGDTHVPPELLTSVRPSFDGCALMRRRACRCLRGRSSRTLSSRSSSTSPSSRSPAERGRVGRRARERFRDEFTK